MGSDREAVVDGELRVRGIEGLRIADASVMPTIPSANTNAPSIMIGEFASRLLVAGRSGAVRERSKTFAHPFHENSLLSRWSGFGTELPIPNVCSSVANGGKADKICEGCP
jgi:hypothetical protein